MNSDNYRHFCRAFVKAAETELNTVLQDPSTTSKVAQCVVTAFCSGIGIAASSPEVGKAAASIVNVLIRKIDEIDRVEKLFVLEQKMGADTNTQEFQKGLRRLMLRSASEIWHSYEFQFSLVRQKSKAPTATKAGSLIRSFRRAVSREGKKGQEEPGKLKSYDKQKFGKNFMTGGSRPEGILVLAKFAAGRCIQYLIEKGECDYPHKFLIAPTLVSITMTKYSPWLLETVSLEWPEGSKEKKSVIQFFADPSPVYCSSLNSVEASTSNMKAVENFWVDPSHKKKLEQGEKYVQKLRRPFDFEWEEFLQKNEFFVTLEMDKEFLANFLKFDFEKRFDDDSNAIDEILNNFDLSTNNDNIEDEDEGTEHLEKILEILAQTCSKMDQFRADLQNIRVDVQKILQLQTEVRCDIIEIKKGQSEMGHCLTDLVKEGREVKSMVHNVNNVQTEILRKVQNIQEEMEQKRVKNLVEIEVSTGVQNFSIFSMTEVPPSNFTGRIEILTEIHELIQKAETETEIEKRMVIICGLGGIGKSSTVKMYVQNFKNYHDHNTAYLNAETEDSLRNSFSSLARQLKVCDHLLKKVGQGDQGSLTKTELDTLVKEVYRHIASYAKKGLIIFDNANQLRSTRDEFGIGNFLPSEILPFYPILLVTSRNRSWPASPYKIGLNCLADEEATKVLMKGLNIVQNNNSDHLQLEKSIKFLATDLLGGFPLALNLAAAAISENLELLGAENDDLTLNKSEVENYATEFHKSGSSWVNYESGDGGGGGRCYDKIMATVWQGTMEGIKSRSKNDHQCLYKMAIDLLNLIAYLPADLISVELCYFSYKKVAIQQEYFAHQLTQIRQSSVRKAFGILEKYSMVSIVCQDFCRNFYDNFSVHAIKVHRLVQKWTRENLRLAQDHEALLKLAVHFQKNVDRFEYFDCIREHLREAGWPDKSYRMSIFHSAAGGQDQNGGEYKQWDDLHQLFLDRSDLQKGDPEFFQTCKIALAYHHRFLSDRKWGPPVEPEVGRRMAELSMTMEGLVDLALDHGIHYPGNQLMCQLVIKVLSYHGVQSILTDRKEQVIEWIRGHFNILQTSTEIASWSHIQSNRPIIFLKLASKLIPPQEFIASVAKAVEFRWSVDQNLDYLTFLSSALLNIPSWPSEIWEKAPDYPAKSQESGLELSRQLFTIFLDNGGLNLLVSSLNKFREIFVLGNFFNMRHMVIFGVIQNLAFFAEFSDTLLNSGEFISSLSQVFDAAVKQKDGTIYDRRAMVGLIFSCLALLVNKNGIRQGLDDRGNQNVSQLIQRLNGEATIELNKQWDLFTSEICTGRFAGSRKGIVTHFLTSHNETTAGVLLVETATKLLAIMDTHNKKWDRGLRPKCPLLL